MPTSANALASLTFAVPPRVEAVQALLRDTATSLTASAPSTRAAPSHPLQAASVALRPTDSGGTKSAAGAVNAVVVTGPVVVTAPFAATTGGNAPPVNPVRIGALGRALAAALPPTSQTGLDAPLPLPEMDVPATATVRFAAALAQAVAQCGLSYEAHLLDWVEGRRSVDQVRTEPRAHMPGPAPSAGTPGSLALPIAPNAALAWSSLPAHAPSALPGMSDVRHVVESPPVAWTAAQQITALQMRCIESGDLRFALQAWPGQICELHLRPDQRSPAPSYGEAGAPQGDGTLVLNLPHLGRVEARLRTRGDNVQITLRSDSTAAAGHFNGAIAALSHGLGLAGLTLAGVMVHEPRA